MKKKKNKIINKRVNKIGKKILLISSSFVILCILLWFSTSFANYTPTETAQKEAKILTNQVKEIIKENNEDLWNFYNQFKTLEQEIATQKEKNKKLEKIHYLLWEVKKELYTTLQERKEQAKKDSKEKKEKFVKKYSIGIKDNDDDTPRCKEHYNLIDDISFAYNFPTALTIATWYRESSCGFYLPNNWDWPFQIITKDYWTGTISETEFSQTIIDFITFSKAKHKRYENKTRVNLTYQDIDLPELVNHASLYNWGRFKSWFVNPIAPWYIFDGYKGEHENAKRYGIFPYTLKTLQRELKNKY